MNEVISKIARRLAALTVAALTSVLPIEATSDLEGSITTVGVVIMLGVYALVAQGLKPLTERFFGEEKDDDD